MSRNELLNNITHKDLKVNPYYSAEMGDDIASTVTFITEFAEVQKEYPILFRKEEGTDNLQAVLLFGIQKGENLFLSKSEARSNSTNGWNANYIPAAVARGPFMIGFQTQMEGGEAKQSPMIHVDMGHAKVSKNDEGVNVFLEQGGNSPYLNHISHLLNLIRDGIDLNKRMFAAFEEFQLIEDVAIDIELDNQDKIKVAGFYTINIDKLNSLDGSALEKLGRDGFLQAAYFVAASLSNIRRLIDIKNKQGES